jgi:magnesium-transporting ATPase (P-type)
LFFQPARGLRIFIAFTTPEKQMEQIDTQPHQNKLFAMPLVGTTLIVMAGLSFFFLCMILPLVGPSGSKTAQAGQNQLAFIGMLLLTTLLAAAASYSKILHRKVVGGTWPYWSLTLTVVCILTLLIQLAGGFAI